MVPGQLHVPVRDHQHGRQAGDPPYEEPQHVEGRLVGPVDVLHDEDGRVLRPVQLGPEGVAHPTPVAGLERVGERASDTADQVSQRPQHPWRGEIIAVAHEQAGPGRQYRAEGVHQARLADPGLAGDDHDGTVPGPGLPGRGGERPELPIAFEDPPGHPRIVAADASVMPPPEPPPRSCSPGTDMTSPSSTGTPFPPTRCPRTRSPGPAWCSCTGGGCSRPSWTAERRPSAGSPSPRRMSRSPGP